MNVFYIWILLFIFTFNFSVHSNDNLSTKLNYEQIINIGKMQSHNKKFTLYFKTREKAVLARGEEFNYIKDFPQDLYYLHNISGKTHPLITYDWFPRRVKDLGSSYDLPIFPEDFAYYLLDDNETLLMISGIKSVNSNYKFSLRSKKLEILSKKDKYELRYVFSLLKNCGFKDINSTYKCSFYKPLISSNLIN